VFARRVFGVRSRLQPSAAACNRPQPFACHRREGKMAVPMASSAKVVFGSFKCRVASFRAAGVALCDIPICFISSRKPFCVAHAILQFSRQAQRFGDLHRHFAWQAQHIRRIVLRAFCEFHCQG